MKPYYEENGITIYHADCRDVLPHLPQVDLVLTDPPYGVNKAEWDNSFPTDWYPLAKKIADTICIITGGPQLRYVIPLVGPDLVDVIAARNLNGMTFTAIGFANWIAAVIAGKKPPQGVTFFDFAVEGFMPSHPSPKPIAYMRKLLRRLLPDGGSLIDPFMGSGTTLRVALNQHISAIGIEIEERYCEIAANRLRQGVLDFEVRNGHHKAIQAELQGF
jgi:site-specific DNA-methyltransferase (adenine-specific)